jgi:hypothetical protein
MAHADHPATDYPPECRELLHKTIERAEAGDIAGCMAWQERANACLRRHGQQALDLPEEYFRLMHLSIRAAEAGDMEGARRISDRMEQVIALTDFEGLPGLPDECKDLLRRSNEAEDRGDTRANVVLTRAYNACLVRHGLVEASAPDEFFALQLAALDAQEAGDEEEYDRLLDEIVMLMQIHGMAGGQSGDA